MNFWTIFLVALAVAAGIQFGFWKLLLIPLGIGVIIFIAYIPKLLWVAGKLILHVADGILTLIGDFVDVYILQRGESIKALMAARERAARDQERKETEARMAEYDSLMLGHEAETVNVKEEEIEY